MDLIEIEDDGELPGGIILQIRGPINFEKVDEFQRALWDIHGKKQSLVLLDLRDVETMDSSGLAAFVYHSRVFANSEKELAIVISAEGYLEELFQVTRIEDICKVFMDYEEALGYMKSRG